MISYELSHCQFSTRFKLIRKTNHVHLQNVAYYKDLQTKQKVIAKIYSFKNIQQFNHKLKQVQKLLPLTNPNQSNRFKQLQSKHQFYYQKTFSSFIAYTLDLNQKQAYFIYQHQSKTLSQSIQHINIHNQTFLQKDIFNLLQNILFSLYTLQNYNKLHHLNLTSELVLTDNLNTIKCSFQLLYTPFNLNAVQEIINKSQKFQQIHGFHHHQNIQLYNLSKQQLKLLNAKNNSKNYNMTYENNLKTDKQSLGLLLIKVISLQKSGIYKFDQFRKIIWNQSHIKQILNESLISSSLKNIIETLLFSENSSFISFYDLYQRTKDINQNFNYTQGSGKRQISNSRRSKLSCSSRQNSGNKSASKSNFNQTKEAVKVNWDSRTNSAYTQSPPKQQDHYFTTFGNQTNYSDSNLSNRFNFSLTQNFSTKNKKIKLTVQDIQQKILLDYRGKPHPGIIQKDYTDGAKYVGQIYNNNIRHGKGIYYYPQGDVYGGDWIQNSLEGFGIYLFTNGQFYQGDILQGLKHGKGTYIYANGNIYVGQWKNDRKQGKGYYQYCNRGDSFKGNFKNGFRDGKGIYRWKNGDSFEGQFTKNLKNGQGVGVLSNGTKISGTWKRDQLQDVVKINFRKGDEYIGQFRQNSINGCGTYKYLQGNLYEGQFKQCNKQGKCQIHFTNGDIYTGQIQNNKFSGKGKYIFKNQAMIYEGNWSNGLQNGKGRVIFDNGTIIQNQWFVGKPDTNGTIYYPNMDKYIGQISSYGRNGNGSYYCSNGSILRGYWVDGNLVQKNQ